MAYRDVVVLGIVNEDVFENVHKQMGVWLSPGAMAPLDRTVEMGYYIRPGTPLAPVIAAGVSTYLYKPIRRTKLTQLVSSGKTLHVANSIPFNAGDVIHCFASMQTVAEGGDATQSTTVVSYDDTASTLTVADNITLASGGYVEVAENGFRTIASAVLYQSIPPDCVISRQGVYTRLANSLTLVGPDIQGVVDGQIRTGRVQGPGTAAFDQLLMRQLPGIFFQPAGPGSGS